MPNVHPIHEVPTLPSRMAVGAQIFNRTIQLAAGREFAEAFMVPYQGVLNVTAQGDLAFYLGVYNRAQFDQARAANPLRFPFLIGSARLTQFLRYSVTVPGEYVWVARVTGWAGPRTATIQVVAQIAP